MEAALNDGPPGSCGIAVDVFHAPTTDAVTRQTWLPPTTGGGWRARGPRQRRAHESRRRAPYYGNITKVLRRAWTARCALTGPAEHAIAPVPSFTYDRCRHHDR